jgi:flagellar motor switch protein FliN
VSDPTITPVLDEQFDQDAPSESGSPSGEGAAGANGANGMAETAAATRAGAGANGDLRRLAEVPMELSVEIGRTQITVGETLALRAGSVVTLDRLAGEPADLLVNGTLIARGEVVVVDEQFGLRLTQIVNGDPAGHTGHAAAQAPSGQDAPPERDAPPEQSAPDGEDTPEA